MPKNISNNIASHAGEKTSATGGYLKLSDVKKSKSIEDVIHDLIAGISGIENSLIRPRWQEEAPNIPNKNINWCAFGISYSPSSDLPETVHHSAGGGYSEIIDYENLEVLISFYGPEAENIARNFKTALYVPQNRESLRPENISLNRVGQIINLPEEAGGAWRRRMDMQIYFKHKVSRTFAVKNILKSTGTLESNSGLIVPIGCDGKD